LRNSRALQACGCLIFALLAPAANAEWLEASGDHFVIYANQDERQVMRFAQRLEQFHAAMAYRFKSQEAKPSPSNRVTVYVVSNRSKVRKLAESNSRYIAGFYVPRAGATVAVIPKLDDETSDYSLSSQTILFHEYAHHYMFGLTARAFPRWFVEGFAEFFAVVKFQPDGGVGLGAPATYRAAELVYGRDVPIRTLLEFDGGAGGSKLGSNAFYGQSWLLFHYLMFVPERQGQLQRYQSLLGTGTPALDAAVGAFGDLYRLEKDLATYQKRKKLSYLVIDGKALKTGQVTIRKLRVGEAEMMPVRMQSRLGVDREEALELLPEARQVAAKHPDDHAVMAALAEAEYDAGNDDDAIAAADKALAIEPAAIDAHIQKGLALLRKAKEGKPSEDQWQEVRNQFIRANKVENDNPIPLVKYYQSFLAQGEPPTANAVSGLEWAMTLAPFDPSLRWLTAQQMISDERLVDAAETLAPLAYSPHPSADTGKALQLLEEVQAKIEDAQATATN
jgi:tetratricopeptide (TPR) repeat protein